MEQGTALAAVTLPSRVMEVLPQVVVNRGIATYDSGGDVLVEDWFWTVVMEVMTKVVVIQLLLGRGDEVRYSFGSSDITQQGDGGSGTGGGKQRICHL